MKTRRVFFLLCLVAVLSLARWFQLQTQFTQERECPPTEFINNSVRRVNETPVVKKAVPKKTVDNKTVDKTTIAKTTVAKTKVAKTTATTTTVASTTVNKKTVEKKTVAKTTVAKKAVVKTTVAKKTIATRPSSPYRARLHLIIQFPVLATPNNSQDDVLKLRQKEYVDSLRKNLISPHVERVHILFEGAEVPMFIEAFNSPGDWKIAYYHLGRRMRYKDAFEYASKNLLNKNVLIMNADCYVDKGFEQLNERILSKKTMYALTRHESPESVDNCGANDFCGPNSKYIGSHDAFLFRLLAPVPSQILNSLDYRPNIVGIERVLMLNFRRHGHFTIKNPCKILHIVHHHCSGLRDKKERFVKGQRMDQYLKLSVKLYGKEIMAPFSGL